jgi:hypothetical protein
MVLPLYHTRSMEFRRLVLSYLIADEIRLHFVDKSIVMHWSVWRRTPWPYMN